MYRPLVFLLIVVAGCAPTTRITGSWKSPNGTHPYHNFFIATLTANTVAKSTIESDLEASLKQMGISAVKSINELPPALLKDSISKEELINTVLSKGNDAILTVTLVKKEAESRYVGGTYAPVTRFGYYGSFWGYYSFWSPQAYDPGYYTTSDIYYLETNLYDSRTEALIWSAQSETYSAGGLQTFSRSFAKMIAGELRKNGLL